MLRLQHPTYCPERVLQSKTQIQKMVVQWIRSLMRICTMSDGLVFCKGTSSKIKYYRNQHRITFFKLWKTSMLNMYVHTIEQHIISKWSVQRRNEQALIQNTRAILKLHLQCTVIWLYKKLSLLHFYWSGEYKVIFMKHIITYMICVIRVNTLDTGQPSEPTVSVGHRLCPC